MTEKEIRDLINTISFIWQDVNNATTDTLYSFCDECTYPTTAAQYWAFQQYFHNYYKLLKEDPKFIIKYVAFYDNFKNTGDLLEYAIKDIAEYLKKK